LDSLATVESVLSADKATIDTLRGFVANAVVPKLEDRATLLQERATLLQERATLLQERATLLKSRPDRIPQAELETITKHKEEWEKYVSESADMAAVTQFKDKISAVKIEAATFIKHLSRNTDIDMFSNRLLTRWEEGLELIKQETDIDVKNMLPTDETERLIGVLLNPFSEGVSNPPNYKVDLRLGHPFNEIPAVLDGKDPDTIIPTVIPNMLVTLAFMNDIINGDVGADTSYFSYMVMSKGVIPSGLAEYNISESANWKSLEKILKNTSWALAGAGLSRESLTLAAGRGGARTTRRRNRNKNRKTKRR